MRAAHGSVQEPFRLASFARCQAEALGCAKRIIREEWPQRVGSCIHQALKRQVPVGASPSPGGGASSSDQVITRALNWPTASWAAVGQGHEYTKETRCIKPRDIKYNL